MVLLKVSYCSVSSPQEAGPVQIAWAIAPPILSTQPTEISRVRLLYCHCLAPPPTIMGHSSRPLSPWKEACSQSQVCVQHLLLPFALFHAAKHPHRFLELRKYPVRGPLPISVRTFEALVTCEHHPLPHGIADMGWHKTSLVPFKSLFSFTQAVDRWWGQ